MLVKVLYFVYLMAQVFWNLQLIKNTRMGMFRHYTPKSIKSWFSTTMIVHETDHSYLLYQKQQIFCFFIYATGPYPLWQGVPAQFPEFSNKEHPY